LICRSGGCLRKGRVIERAVEKTAISKAWVIEKLVENVDRARRVSWHTHDNNERARTVYDQLAKQTDYICYDIEV
jgi:hypothetical protein